MLYFRIVMGQENLLASDLQEVSNGVLSVRTKVWGDPNLADDDDLAPTPVAAPSD